MLGIIKNFLRVIKKRSYKDIDPDEIFLDSENLPKFDTHQFEGRVEHPTSRHTSSIFGAIFVLVVVVFFYKLGSLQIVNGEDYRERSENNKLKQLLIVAPRGIIYSREGKQLAWNQKSDQAEDFSARKYTSDKGFGNLLGFVKYPAKDKSGFYYEEEFLAKDGAELYLDETLSGINGTELIETSVNGEVLSNSVIELPKSGESVFLSIDEKVQIEFYKIIEKLAGSVGFQGGAGAIMDIYSGEMLAMVSFPEYDSLVMTEGKEIEKIEAYFKNPNNPFLNRTIGGLYTPGSIVKPFLALAALEEKIITPEKEIVSTGKLIVPNPYFPDQPSVFKDWKAHGAVDIRRAISVSSDVYFYQIGGGFGIQKGLGIEKIKKYLEDFGFTKKTGFDLEKEVSGVIPDPAWKEEIFDGEVWRIGDTYNTAIGQYGMQITPIQAVVATAALANGGTLVTPSLFFTSTSTIAGGKKIEGKEENFQIVKEGMR